MNEKHRIVLKTSIYRIQQEMPYQKLLLQVILFYYKFQTVAKPVRLIVVDFEFHFEKQTTKHLLAKLIFIIPRVVTLKQSGINAGPTKLTSTYI